jgi:hypothetical protein
MEQAPKLPPTSIRGWKFLTQLNNYEN